MKTGVVLFLAGAIVTLAVVSVVAGWIPCRADLAFLCVAGFSVVSYVAWSLLSPWFDNTNGNDVSLIACLQIWFVMLLGVVGAPVAVLLGVSWLHATLAACGVVLAIELVAAWQMSR